MRSIAESLGGFVYSQPLNRLITNLLKKSQKKIVQAYKIFNSLSEAQEAVRPGTPVLLNFSGYKVCLARTEAGFRAFAEKCPHSFASLQTGRLNAENEVVCPLHAYRFDLQTGRETSGKSCPDLPIFPIEINETGFYVRF